MKKFRCFILIIAIIFIVININSYLNSKTPDPSIITTTTVETVDDICLYWIQQNNLPSQTLNILKSLPDYKNIISITNIGAAGFYINIKNSVGYYGIICADTTKGIMTIDTAEENYKDRTRIYQSY